MHRFAKGTFGSGLPRASKGMLPLAHGTQECPCDFESNTAWEGPQIVVGYYPPGSADVESAPGRQPCVRVLRRLRRYPQDIEDGQLVDTQTRPFSTTAYTAETILASVPATAGPVYSTNLELTSTDDSLLDEADHEEPFIPGSVTINLIVGAMPFTITDDGMGQFVRDFAPLTVVTGSSINYCTHEITLDLTPADVTPDVASVITMDYHVTDWATQSTLALGTISGGVCTNGGAGNLNYTTWTGYYLGNVETVAAGVFAFGAAPDGDYVVYIDMTLSIASGTMMQPGFEHLAKVTVAAGLITRILDMRLLMNFIEDTTEPFAFYYYSVFVFDLVSMSWHRCFIYDYALEYDSTKLFGWLWKHLPDQWKTDDPKGTAQIMPVTTITDGQQININEDQSVIRGQLYRFLKFFGLELERDRAYIRAIAILYIDTDQAPPPILRLQAEMLGTSIPETWDLLRQCTHVKQVTASYRRKGTIESILMAAYRVTEILPTYDFMHERILYSNHYTRTSLDTTLPGGVETETDPHHYSWSPTRERHHHERGLSLFFSDPTHKLLLARTQTLKIFTVVGSGPIYETDYPQEMNRLAAIDVSDYLQPGSVTLNWVSGGVPRSMTDDAYGGFLAAGDGNPAGSSVDYQARHILLDTRGDAADAGTTITVTFTSTNPSLFSRMRIEVEKTKGATVHMLYFVNGFPMGVSQ